jgi:hypothetical protein
VSGKYDQYIHHPPHMRLTMKADGSTVFDGLMIGHQQIGFPFMMGHQFVRKPFKGDNPCHIHNFHEILAWYGSNPDDPDELGGEVILYMGPEMEKHVFTCPTLVYLPPGIPHCPLEITRVDRPIIQIEIMLAGAEGTREPYFEADQDFDSHKVMNFETIPYGKDG